MIYCSSPSEAASVFTLRQPASDEGEERIEFGTEVCLMLQKQLHSRRHASCTLHDWNLYIPTEKKPSSMSSWIWLHESSSLTAWSASCYPSFPFEELLKTKWCHFLWWRTLKINPADTFKDYSKKGGIPQGWQMAVFIVQMWQFVIDCAVTHWEWKHIQYSTAPVGVHF